MVEVNLSCVQCSSVYLDNNETLKKMIQILRKAVEKKSNLVVFPELLLSGYPNFMMMTQDYKNSYINAAITLDSVIIESLSVAAEKYKSVIVTGFIERDPEYPEVIYDSACIIDADGTICGSHRKIVPFGAEKTIFKQGDARDVKIFETSVGRIGVGLCFENLNPLYRRALSLLGEELHLSLWVTTNESKHIVESSSIMTAVESGIHVAVSSQITQNPTYLEKGLNFIGGSCVIDPLGRYIKEPEYGNDSILKTSFDPSKWDDKKIQFRGTESRDDIFSINIATEPYMPLNYINSKGKRISQIFK